MQSHNLPFYRKIHLRIQAILHKDAGVAAALDLFSVDRNCDNRGKVVAPDGLSVAVIADRLDLVSRNADLFSTGLQRLVSIVVISADRVAVSDEGALQLVDGRTEPSNVTAGQKQADSEKQKNKAFSLSHKNLLFVCDRVSISLIRRVLHKIFIYFLKKIPPTSLIHTSYNSCIQMAATQ